MEGRFESCTAVMAPRRRPSFTMIHVMVDYKLFWIACKDEQEANYLLAIINSQALYQAVEQFMSKGQFGARDLQKQLWKLPIPEFDSHEPLHVSLSEAGQAAAEGRG